MNEAQTRIKLIDDELIKCGWNIKDITKVIEEEHDIQRTFKGFLMNELVDIIDNKIEV